MRTLNQELKRAGSGLRRLSEQIPDRSWNTVTFSSTRPPWLLSFAGGSLLVIALFGVPALILSSSPSSENAGQDGGLAVPTVSNVPSLPGPCDPPATTSTISPSSGAESEQTVEESRGHLKCDSTDTTTTTIEPVLAEEDPSVNEADDGTTTASVGDACFTPMILRLENDWPVVEVWDRRVEDGFLSLTFALNTRNASTQSVVLVLGREGAEIPLLTDLEASGEISQTTVRVHGTTGELNRYSEDPLSLHWARSDGIDIALVLLQVPPSDAADPEALLLRLAESVEEMDEDEFTELVTNFESYQLSPWSLPCADPDAG